MAEQIEILVVDDDKEIANLVEIYLSSTGYKIHKAYNAVDGLALLQKYDIKLAIIDVMMPQIDGIEMCRRIRTCRNIPIIILSAKSADVDKILGLNIGADDYITKPFEIQELIARVGVQIRRFTGSEETPKQLQYKDLVLNKVSFTASVNGEEIVLTKQEFKILELLLSYPNKVFSKQDIYDYAWNDIYIGEDKTINVHISNIRKKLKAVSSEEYIETVWGIGFRLAR